MGRGVFSRTSRSWRDIGGASLLEVSICLAILGVLTVPALEALKDLRERRRLHAVAAQVYADLQYARSESVRSGGTIHLSFADSTEGFCYWMHTGKTSACTCDAAGQVTCAASGALIRAYWLPRTSATQMRANVGRMTFQGEQGTVSSAGTIEVSVKNGPAVRHVVSIMGRIRSCSPDSERGAMPRC